MKTNIVQIYASLAVAGCAVLMLLMANNAQAQNLFVGASSTIAEITPDGTQSTFASTGASGLLFNGNNLFASISGAVYEFTPDGTESLYVKGVSSGSGLAFNSAGDLFISQTFGIVEYTPGVGISTFATKLNNAKGLAFNSAGDLFEADFRRATSMNLHQTGQGPHLLRMKVPLRWLLTVPGICS